MVGLLPEEAGQLARIKRSIDPILKRKLQEAQSMVPQCIPHRQFVSEDNRPGLAHYLRFYTFHCQPVLAAPGWCEHLAEAVASACAKHTYVIWAYAFLPDHVRLLVKPEKPPYDLRGFIRDLKDRAETTIITTSAPEYLRRLRIIHNGERRHRLWQQGTGPIESVSSAESAAQRRALCDHAAVEVGCVRSPEEWRWSSVHWSNNTPPIENFPIGTWSANWSIELSGKQRVSMLREERRSLAPR
jgi:REP element-mobilizing transposase RayT